MEAPVTRRMIMVASMVLDGDVVADIGCDHAYTSIYMIEKDIANHVIAMDINKGPLQKAAKNIRNYGYEDKIETRLSDGMQKLEPGQVDTILISGMGGELICRILSQGTAIINDLKQIILQPQTEVFLVRHYLHEHGFMIQDEQMVFEEGKYYVSIRAIRGHQKYSYEYQYRYGDCLLRKKDSILYQYMEKEYKTQHRILDKLESTALQSENIIHRIEKVKETIDELEKVKGEYYHE